MTVREEGQTLVATHVAPGSYLVISHATDEEQPADVQRVVELYRNTANPLTLRSRAAITPFFSGFDLVEPGVVWAPEWQPESPDDIEEIPRQSAIYVGVGRLP